MEACFPDVEVLLTEKIKCWISSALETNNLDEESRKRLQPYTPNNQCGEKYPKTIPFVLVKAIHGCIESDEGNLYLHELLEGSDIHLPQPELPKRSSELEERLKKLREEQENKEYARMTKNVARQVSGTGDSIGQEMKTLNRHIITVFNFILTVVCSFVFAYKAVEYASETPRFEVQLLSGMSVATLVFFADLYFLIKNDL